MLEVGCDSCAKVEDDPSLLEAYAGLFESQQSLPFLLFYFIFLFLDIGTREAQRWHTIDRASSNID